MSRKKYILSGKPRLSQSNYSGTGGIPSRLFKDVPTESLNQHWWFKPIETSKAKSVKLTPAERRRILSQENAEFGIR